jgi:alpha-galactosidase
MRPLENGDLALAFFNRTEGMITVTAYWEILGLKGKHKVRDLWAHEDLGSFRDAYSAQVAAHGVVMVRVSR